MRLAGREANAATESGHRERVKNLNLSFSEWISFMISRDHLSRGADRIGLIEHHVSQGNRQIANGRRMDHIAIIENRIDTLFGSLTNKNVVVVRVVVDDAETQTTPVDLLPCSKESFDHESARFRQQAD